MKKVFSYVFLTVISAVIIAGCGSKQSPKPEISELVKFTDATTKFEIKYPKAWIIASEIGHQFVAYSSQSAQSQFKNLTNMETEEEAPGTKIQFVIAKVEEGKSIDEIIKSAKGFDASIYSAPENITIDGTPATKQKYTFPYKTNSVFNGEIYIATKDSQLVNIILIEDIGSNLDALRPKINEILASVKLGTKQVAAKKDSTVQEPGPTETMKAASGQGFSMQIPTNFELFNNGAKGNVQQQYSAAGQRRGDCYFSVDIIDAKKNTLDKVADSFVKGFGNYTKTSFGGSEAVVYNWKAKANIESKVYVAVRNGKIYRVIVSYYKPEADIFKSAFDKMTKSFKFN